MNDVHFGTTAVSVYDPQKERVYIIRLNKLRFGVFGVAKHRYDIHFAIWGGTLQRWCQPSILSKWCYVDITKTYENA